jgi:GNAT superfamily N-acetyltransferase
MKVSIRKFSRGDEKKVAKLICETFRKYNSKDGTKKGVERYLERHSPERPTDELFRRYNREISFVALEGKNFVGFLKGESDHLINLFVDGKHHGKGIGKMLMEKFESAAKKKNSREIKISASIYAIPFYERRGYKKTTGIRNKFGLKVPPMKKIL